jgi:hypothetical protein
LSVRDATPRWLRHFVARALAPKLCCADPYGTIDCANSQHCGATDLARFLTYTPWRGELNNTRICFETAAVLAFLEKRILVIPNGYRLRNQPEWHNNTFRPLHPQEFLDLNALSRVIPLLSYEQYISLPRRNQICHLRFGVNTSVFCYPNIPTRDSRSFLILKEFAAGRTDLIEFTTCMKDSNVLHIEHAMLEHFYSFIFFLDHEKARECKSLVRDHITFKPELFHIAGTIAKNLGSFSAVHIRRGDFIEQYPSQNVSAGSIRSVVDRHVTPGAKLYIATDENERSFFDTFRARYRIMFLSDVKHLVPSTIPEHLLAPLEQIICSLAGVFIGTRLSTFSAYITRLRGYRRAPDTNVYFTDGYHLYEPLRRIDGSYSWSSWVNAGNPLWGREFKEAWEL